MCIRDRDSTQPRPRTSYAPLSSYAPAMLPSYANACYPPTRVLYCLLSPAVQCPLLTCCMVLRACNGVPFTELEQHARYAVVWCLLRLVRY
eukprot:1682841-Rhodomonas_salina.1